MYAYASDFEHAHGGMGSVMKEERKWIRQC